MQLKRSKHQVKGSPFAEQRFYDKSQPALVTTIAKSVRTYEHEIILKSFINTYTHSFTGRPDDDENSATLVFTFGKYEAHTWRNYENH